VPRAGIASAEVSDLSLDRDWLESTLGAHPTDPALYERALTHGSTGKEDYQRLEFLGDRVLGLAIADLLYRKFPDEAEGRLSHRLNSLVSRQVCAEVGRAIGVSDQIKLGKQARDDGARDSDNVLGDVVEAMIGAIYVDLGIDAAFAFVSRNWMHRIDAAQTAPKHPKSELQEWCAAKGRKMPHYEITSKEGPPHAMRFEITVTIKGFDPVTATGTSKQTAETAAAEKFLELNA
jgi:ribonuclease-3